MNEPILIMMTGRPAAGKTTLAKKLVKATNATYISSHTERERFKAELVCQDFLDEELRNQAYESMITACDKNLKEGLSTIVDATFHKAHRRKALFEAMKKTASNIWVLYCVCDDTDETVRRIRKRRKTSHRIDDRADNPEIYEYNDAGFQEPSITEVPTVIPAKIMIIGTS